MCCFLHTAIIQSEVEWPMLSHSKIDQFFIVCRNLHFSVNVCVCVSTFNIRKTGVKTITSFSDMRLELIQDADSCDFSDRILDFRICECYHVGRADLHNRSEFDNAFFNCKVIFLKICNFSFDNINIWDTLSGYKIKFLNI